MAMTPSLLSSLNQFRDTVNQQQSLKVKPQRLQPRAGGLAAALLPPTQGKGLAAAAPQSPTVQATGLPGVFKATPAVQPPPLSAGAQTPSLASVASQQPATGLSGHAHRTGTVSDLNPPLMTLSHAGQPQATPVARSLADAGINRTQFNEIDAATGKVTPMTRYEAEQGYAEFEGNPGDPAKRLGLASGGGGFVGALTNAQAAARLSDYAARGLDHNGNDLSVANQLNAKADQMRQERIARNEQRQAFRQANTIDAQRNHALATLRRENPAAYAKAVLDMPQESAVGGLAAENQRNRVDLQRIEADTTAAQLDAMTGLQKAAAQGQRAPLGYRFTPEGNLQPIPGGPADRQSPEQAAKTQMLQQGITDLQTARSMVFNEDGSINRANLVTMKAGVPFSEGRNLYSHVYNAIEARLRAESGAAVPETEVTRMAKRFVPSPLDSEKTVKSKMTRLQHYLEGGLKKIDPSGRFSATEAPGLPALAESLGVSMDDIQATAEANGMSPEDVINYLQERQ